MRTTALFLFLYTGSVLAQVGGTGQTANIPVQGTDSNVLSSGTVSALSSALLCTDAQGGATTVNCALYPQSISSGPYLVYFDDYMLNNTYSSGAVGSPTGNALNYITALDNTSPGIIQLVSGTVSGAGEQVSPANSGHPYLFNPSTAPPFLWEGRVQIPVLPGTTAASYNLGMVTTGGVTPWTTGIGFYLSSANGVANDWYCRYSSTQTDSTLAAVAATWTRLTVYDDGTNVHWYINGTQVCGTGVAIGSMPTGVEEHVYTVVAGSTTSVNLDIDYTLFRMNVSR